MRTRWIIIPFLLAGCASGADVGVDESESDPDAVVEARGELTSCGERSYDFVNLTQKLQASEQLLATVGFSEVDSCERALSFEKAYYELLESTPAEASDVYAPPEDPDGVGTTAQEIQNGTVTWGVGAVQIITEKKRKCTGTIIGPRAILTAAHCVDDLFAGDNGNTTVDIDKFVYSNGIAQRVDAFEGQVRVNIHPSHNGTASFDVALLKLFPPAKFPNFSSSDYNRIYTGFLSQTGGMWLYGRGVTSNAGTGSGTLRRMPFNADWSNGDYFISDAGFERACEGDSGGPVISWMGNGKRVVSGLVVNVDGDTACAAEGAKQRAVRLQHKIGWIEDMLDISCVPADNYDYVRCW